MPVVTPPVPEPAEPGVRELRAPVWTEPLTAEEWVARDPELEPDCGYRYRFEPHELEAIKRCHDNHGFAVVTGVLEPGEVEALRADVEMVLPRAEIDDEQSTVRHAFAEFSPVARGMLLHKKYIDIQMLLLGVTPGVDDDELTVHRSAAIVRKPGAGKEGGASSPWHSDFTGYEPLPLMNASVHLNRGEGPNGKWFYLNGAHPRRGGLAIVAESHLESYEPPPGFRWADGRARSSLERLKDDGEWVSA